MKAIVCGDCLNVMAGIPDNSVELVCTDPPYGLEFMGLEWDRALPDKRAWSECFRILKPGAHMFVMAIPRMYHRVAVAIEDAGFVINSPLVWLFASGFPKALDISKAFDKRAFVEWLDSVPHGLDAAEKRKVVSAAVSGSIDTNPNLAGREARTSFKGGLEIPDSRKKQDEGARLLADIVARFWDGEGLPPGMRMKVGEYEPPGREGRTRMMDGAPFNTSYENRPCLYNLCVPSTPLARQWEGWKSPQLKPAMEMIVFASKPLSERSFVENVERHGVGGINVDAARIPGQPFTINTWDNGMKPFGDGAGHPFTGRQQQGRYPANVIAEEGCVLEPSRVRFFNLTKWAETHGICDTPKASRKEKKAGLEGLEAKDPKWNEGNWVSGGTSPGKQCKKTLNPHATVKPIALMSWLISLGCPLGGLVCDPFCGTGSTLIAAKQLGMGWLGIDIDPKWCDIARRRLMHWRKRVEVKQEGLFEGRENE